MRKKDQPITKVKSAPKYYSVQFQYPPPHCTEGEEEPTKEQGRNLREHNILLERKLSLGLFEFRHNYSWPDGSLHKYFQVEGSATDLKNDLEDALADSDLKIAEIKTVNAKFDPRKHGVNNLEEYFKPA